MCRFTTCLFVCLCVLSGGMLKQIPDYIQICKRDPNTIDACVRESIEKLRPKLAEGIPELEVPAIEPFYIPEIVAVSREFVPLTAIGKDVKVTGAGNFTIKSLSLDLDTFTIKGHLRFPKLHFDGSYKLDTRILMLPLHGQGNIVADAVKCDAEVLLKAQVWEREGKKYINFTSLDTGINVKDYRVKIDGLFNGDKALGDAANEAINQNRGEFLRASKPYVESTVSKILLETANKIAGDVALDDFLPEP